MSFQSTVLDRRTRFVITLDAMSKRKSYEIREEHIQAGAVCIQIDCSKGDWAQPGVSALESADKNMAWGRGNPKNTYATMERKGFRFTADCGCFAPVKRYTMKSGGANERGYQLSFYNKHGFMLSQPDPEETSVSLSAGNPALQLSHRCHRRWCCRLDHLAVEPRWRNVARNFCLGPIEVDLPGQGKTKTCGCSLQYHFCGKPELAGPPCLRAWSSSPPEVPVDIGEIVSSTGGIKTLLTQTQFPFPFRFVVWDERKVASQKREQRDELKKLKGKALANGLAQAGLASPDLQLSKKTKLVSGDDVPFSGNPKLLAYAEYDSDDDFEAPAVQRRKV